jgi:hypothetical protein
MFLGFDLGSWPVAAHPEKQSFISPPLSTSQPFGFLKNLTLLIFKISYNYITLQLRE